MRKILPLGFFLLLCTGCAALFQPPTAAQLPVRVYGDIDTARHITVLLPGIRDRGDDFVKEGFIEIAKPSLQQHQDTALITVDAHWGYYREQTVHELIDRDILSKYPDKLFTLVGVSLGGFGALLAASHHPDRIRSLVLLSPFLGEDDYQFLERLKRSGVQPQEGDEDLETVLTQVWAFLTGSHREIPVFLGFGHLDSFAPYYAQLMAMQAENISYLAISGDHDWETWRRLWETAAPIAVSGAD